MNRNPVTCRLSIVVPIYNEEESLKAFYEKLIGYIPQTYEIIFVDDGSTDRSLELLQEIRRTDPDVKIISLSRNMGHQIALTAGLDYAEGDIVITIDADLQHPPELIPKMLDTWKEGYDIVNMVKERTIKRGALKNTLSSIFYWVFNKMSDIRLNPNASDFRLFDKSAVEAVRQIRDHQRFIRGFASWVGFKTKDISYVAPERFAGKPAYTIGKLYQLATQGFFSFGFVPLKIPIYIGLGITVVALLHLLIYIIVPLLLGKIDAPTGWVTLVFLQTLFGGITFIILGVMGIYLAQIFIETKKRPIYFIREKVGFESGRQATAETFAKKEIF